MAKSKENKRGKGRKWLIIIAVILILGGIGNLRNKQTADSSPQNASATAAPTATSAPTAAADTATPSVSSAPTAAPTEAPTPEPTATPTPTPTQTPTPTPTPSPTAIPTDTPKPTRTPAPTADASIISENGTARGVPAPILEFGLLLTATENQLDSIVTLHARISPSYSNKATINQNYQNIEKIAKEGWYKEYDTIAYWADALMTDGSYAKVISFDVSRNVMDLLAEGKLVATMLGDYVTINYIHPSLMK